MTSERERQASANPRMPASLTDVARMELADGSFDALRAVHFLRRFPPHFHETFAFGVVEAGATQLRTQRGEWVARSGTILAFSPGEIHSAEALTEDGYAYRMIYPTVDFMLEIGARLPAPEQQRPSFVCPVIHDPALANELLKAHRPLMDGANDRVAESKLVEGILTLVQRHGCPDGAAHDGRRVDLQIVERARQFLRQRFAEPVRLAMVAEECGLSPFHLIRVFRRVVGVPPYAYLVQLRVNRAQAMLCSGSSISDVAYSCGFSDQSHLTRTFKKAVGVTPGQYLRQVRQTAA